MNWNVTGLDSASNLRPGISDRPGGRTFEVTPRGETVRRLYEQLRHLIIEGHYRPGERLSQERIVSDLSAGRTPLREALRMLEAEGLVRAESNRGITVKEAPLHDAEEYYGIRLLLEPPLLAVTTSTLTQPHFVEMARHLSAMERTANRHKEFQQAHLKFHLVAVNRYGNRGLQNIVIDLYQRIHRHQQAYMSRPRIPEDFLTLDRMLLEALRAGDGEFAKQTLQFHLIDAAIGLILDVDPDHRFDPLPRAAAATGVQLAVQRDGRIARPTELRWVSAAPQIASRDLRTTNLTHVGRPKVTPQMRAGKSVAGPVQARTRATGRSIPPSTASTRGGSFSPS